jgi:hypothetical protein
MIPYNLCFSVHPEGGKVVFDTLIDCFFMLDICKLFFYHIFVVINFNTGFYRKGVVVMKRRDIIFNYLKTWFWIDLLSSFPYNWVFNLDE